jgi:ribonuclease HI
VPKKKFEPTGMLFDLFETPKPAPKPVATRSVTIYTDGACSPNPGFGGWAAVIIDGEQKRHVKGGTADTTNNRMELQAAIEGLRSLAEPSRVKLYTDSKYVRSGITSWLHNWVRRGWKTTDKAPVKNQDLWQELSGLTKLHHIDWKWVRGHNGDPLNEECDQLAQGEAGRRKQMVTGNAKERFSIAVESP